jgi:endonuclease/exonuclease/phosphatase family metal-dependent hydrolase
LGQVSVKAGGSGTVAAVVLVSAILLILAPMLTLLVILRPHSVTFGCGADSAEAASVRLGLGIGDLSVSQRANAAAVIAEGRRRRLPDQAIVIALAVASQESRFTNYANDGEGGDLRADQLGIRQSLELPHEAVGTDHGSLGIFQQQWPWWGSMADLMDPTQAAGKFYDVLGRVPGWASMAVTVAAQRVQHSAYPAAYADDEPLARQLLAAATTTGVEEAALAGSATPACDQAGTTGTVVFPLPPGSGFTDQRNWGSKAAVWAHGHTGTDLSVACGTPVLAATDGRVLIRTDQPWAGRWLVQVSTGVGMLTTWYAHMRALDVRNGQTVTAGQQIGEVGDLGNASGCHLHFEVHPHGGSIYQDNVNPTEWLRNHVGRSLGGSAGTGFVVATFNTLGASHTTAHGNEPWMASGPARTRGMVQLLERHNVDVAGLQEFQRPQYRTFARLVAGIYASYSARGDTENAVIWRRDRWRLLSVTTFPIPYFDGHPRRMPIVRLSSRATGRTLTVVNVHNPADTRDYPRQGRWRAKALAIERRVVRAQTDRGHRLLVVGDFNDSRAPFCQLAVPTNLVAPAGGHRGPPCRPPNHAGIDWIFGSSGIQFHRYLVDRSALVRHTTDHPVVLATAS